MKRTPALAFLLTSAFGCGDTGGPTLKPGPPASLQIVSGDQQQDTVGLELDQPLVVRVLDALDGRVPNQIVNFRVTAGGGSVFGGAAITNDSGEARERWTVGTVAGDTQRVEARAVDSRTGAALVFGAFRAVGVPDRAATVQIAPATAADSALYVGGDTVLTDDSLRVTAIVRDRYGNLKSGTQPTWTSTDTNVASISSTGSVRAKAVGAVTLRSVAETASAMRPIVVQLRVPKTLALLAGGGQADTIDATLATQVQVLARDRRSASFAGATIAFTGTNGAPTDVPAGCSCKVLTTDANGIASTAWILGIIAGSSRMQARGTAPSSGSAFDSLVVIATVRQGAAASLAKVSGGGQNTGLIVAVRDRRGNPVPSVVVRWRITSGTGTLSDTLSVSDLGGLAGTSVSQASGSVTVEASVTGLTGSPVSFTVTAAPNLALDFNQSYVNVPDDTAIDLTTAWTLEAWVYPRAAGNGSDQDIISKWAGAADASYIMQIDRTGVLRVVTNNGSTQTIALSNTGLVNNAWQHVAATFEGDNLTGTLNLYINGVLDKAVANALTPINSTQPLAFGREGNYPGGTLNGVIDEVRLWKVVRSAADLATYRTQRLAGTEPGLVGYWRFDEGSEDVAFDATGRRNHGRLGTSVGVDAWDPQWTSNAAPIP